MCRRMPFNILCKKFMQISMRKLFLQCINILQLAEVPSAARVNLQAAEHLLFYKECSKMSPSAFSILGPPGPGGEGVGVKSGPKPSSDRWGCVCKISSRSEDRCKGLDFH